jgi:hypothetical protein
MIYDLKNWTPPQALMESFASGSGVADALAATQKSIAAYFGKMGAPADKAAEAAKGFTAGLSKSLASGVPPGEAIATVRSETRVVSDGEAAGSSPAAPGALVQALARGENVQAALTNAVGKGAVTKQHVDAFVNTLQNAIAKGVDLSTALKMAEAGVKAVDIAKGVQGPASAAAGLMTSLAGGGDAAGSALKGVTAGMAPDQAKAFLQTFQSAAASGADTGTALKLAGQAATQQAEMAAAQTVTMSAADQMIASLANGGASGLGRGAGLEAMLNSLAKGANAAQAAQAGAQAAEAQGRQAAAQAVPVSPGQTMMNALASGTDAGAVLGGGGTAFAQALSQALASGSDIGAATQQAAKASQAAESQTAVSFVPMSAAAQLGAALASGSGAAEAVHAAAGSSGGDANAFANALSSVLSRGGDFGAATQLAGNAATAAQQQTGMASQGITGDPTMMAMASGIGIQNAFAPSSNASEAIAPSNQYAAQLAPSVPPPGTVPGGAGAPTGASPASGGPPSIASLAKSETITFDGSTGGRETLPPPPPPPPSYVPPPPVVLDTSQPLVQPGPISIGSGHTSQAYVENDGAIIIDAHVAVGDPDKPVTGAKVKIVSNYVSGEDVLTFAPQYGVTGLFNAATGELVLTGAAAASNYALALSHVTYTNTSDDPSGAARTIRFSVTDDRGGWVTVDETVTVQQVNDAPMMTGTVANFTENTPEQMVTTAGMSDLDGHLTGQNFNTGWLKASLAAYNANDVLSIVDGGGITVVGGAVSYNGAAIGTVSGGSAADLTIALNTVAATQQAVQALLGRLTFTNTSDDPTVQGAVPSRALTVTVDDGGNTGTGGHLTNTLTGTITITAVNDAPVLGGSLATAYTENAPVVQLVASPTVADVDAQKFSGGWLKAALASYVAGDTLSVVDGNGITVSGGAVSYNGTAFGTVSGGSAADLTIALSNAAATAQAVQALMGQLRYASSSDDPTVHGTAATRSLTVTLDDGANYGTPGSLTGSLSSTIALTANNDAPTMTVSGAKVVNEDTSLAISGISLADFDDGGAAMSMTVTATGGNITLAQTTGLTFTADHGNGTKDLVFTGTKTAINEALATLSYQSLAHVYGADTISLTIDDQGNSGTGGALTASSTIGVTVGAVNDAPTFAEGAGLAVTAVQQGTAAASIPGTAIADIVDDGGIVEVFGETAVEALAVVGASSSPGIWYYKIGGGAWTAIGSISDSSALLLDSTDQLRFVPTDTNWYGTASLTVRAWDKTDAALANHSAGNKVSTLASTAYSAATADLGAEFFEPVLPSFTETFASASAWRLSYAAGVHADPGSGSNVLRLTQDNVEDSRGAAVYNRAFASNLGIHATFDYYSSHNDASTAGDGLTFFLLNGAVSSPTAGNWGGSLGYGAKAPVTTTINLGFLGSYTITWAQGVAGVSRAYAAVGFDDHSDSVKLLAGGNGYSGYGTVSSVDVAAVDGGWRKVDLATDAQGRITVKMSYDGGTTWTPVYTDRETGGTLPSTLKFGFSAGSGSRTGDHFVDNVKVEQNFSVGAQNALRFDGSQEASVAHQSKLAPTSGITVEAWVRTSATGAQTILSKSDGADGYVLRMDTAGKLWFDIIKSGVTTSIDYAAGTINDGGWHHVAGAYWGDAANGTMSAFVDGVNNTSGVIGSGKLGASSTSLAFGTGFTGDMADARVWNYARPVADILRDVTHEVSGAETGLVGSWRMDEASGTTLTDATLNGYNGSAAAGQVRVDQNQFTLDRGQSFKGLIHGFDATQDKLSYTVASGPTYGTLTLNANGSYTYTATSGVSREDSFQVTVNSLKADNTVATTLTTTVQAHIVTHTPTVTAAQALTIGEDASGTVIGFSFTDPNETTETVQVTASSGAVTLAQTTGLAVTGGANGSSTMTVTGTVAAINAAIGSLSYVPVANYNGAATITVTATDPGGLSHNASATITVTAVNDAPVLNTAPSPALAKISQGDATSPGDLVSAIVVDGTITDVDATGTPPEAIAITRVDNSHGAWQYSIDAGLHWTAIDDGSLSATHALMLNATDKVRFVPNGGYNGSADFDYKAWDQTSGTAHGYVDTTAGTAFSTAAETAAITVLPTPVGFPFSENFTQASFDASAWVIGGGAQAKVDTDDRLHLTEAVNSQAGYAFYNTAYSTKYGLRVTFDYFDGNTSINSPGDGFSFILVDGSVATPTAGAAGAGLGYGYAGTGIAGAAKAYLGIGFDEFGNFASSDFNPDANVVEQVGGGGAGGGSWAAFPDTVSMRGSATAANSTATQQEYDYIANSLVSVAAYGGIDGGSRKVDLTITADQRITMSMSWDNGATWKPIYTNFDFSSANAASGAYSLPDTLKLGFAASTGGANNQHYIDNVSVSIPTDLSVSLGTIASPHVGTGNTFTASVANLGPMSDQAATVAYTAPAGFTVTGWSYTTNGGDSGSGVGNISTALNLSINEVATVTITGTVADGYSGVMSHSAQVTASNGVTDSNAANNTATSQATIFAPPVIAANKAMVFSGDDWVGVSNHSDLTPASGVTVEAWIKTTGTTTAKIIDSCVGESQGFYLGLNAVGQLTFVWSTTGSNAAGVDANGAGDVVNDGAWHHVAGTYDTATGTYGLYVDGVVAKTGQYGSGTLKQSNEAFEIGRAFTGQIDDVRVWDTARSAAEILQSKTNSNISDTSHLMGSWKFNEGTGTSVADSSVKSHDATASGTPEWADQYEFSVASGSSYKGMVLGSDTDSQSLAYALGANNGGVTMSGNTFTYAASGGAHDDTFTVNVSDGVNTVAQTITIHVT